MTDRLWPRWMSTKIAAEYLCRAPGTLENWRYLSDPNGPPWFNDAHGKPCYDRLELDAYMERQKGAA